MLPQNELKELIFLYAAMKRFVADTTESQLKKIESLLGSKLSYEEFENLLNLIIKNEAKRSKILSLYKLFYEEVNVNSLTALAINYLKFKDHIFETKRNYQSFGIIEDILKKRFSSISNKGPSYKLTMTYDSYTTLMPYTDRVLSAYLLNKKSSNFMNEKPNEIFNSVFQIILDEAIMQSGRSNSGGDYESRIAELFDFYKLKYAKHHHEEDDQSQEHDFLVSYKGKKIGVGAKRTLRERYKQYAPVEVDYSLVFTIGEDLNEPKAKTITENYQSVIFVADEIYSQCEFLLKNNKVFKVTDFSLEILDEIIKGYNEN